MGTDAHNLRETSNEPNYDLQFLSDENSVIGFTDFGRDFQQPRIQSNHSTSSFELGTRDPFLEPIDGLKLDISRPFFDSISLIDFPDVPYALDQNSSMQTSSSTSGPSLTTSSSSNLPSSSSPSLDLSSGSNLSTNTIPEGDHHDDTEELSDLVFTYINNMLMQEDMDDKPDMYQEPSVVQATEKALSDLIDHNYSSSVPVYDGVDDSISGDYYINSNRFSGNGEDRSWLHDYFDNEANQTPALTGGFSLHSSLSSLNAFSSMFQELEDPLPTAVGTSKPATQGVLDFWSTTSAGDDLSLASIPAWQFMKGVEEASKFLPSKDKLVVDLEASGVAVPLETNKEKSKGGKEMGEVKAEQVENVNSTNVSRGRKHAHHDDFNLEEGRSVKQSAIYTEDEAVRTKMFDEVLLCRDTSRGENGKPIAKVVRIREAVQQDSHAKSSNGRGRGKRLENKEVVDLRTLLIHCAQMVAADDRRGATELLKQIRQHSSPCGDGNQRLAHYFADGLEARLAGTGSQVYNSLVSKRRSASSILRAYQLFIAASPFKKITYFVSNRTMLDVAENAMRVHIVDFGIYFGFQWPCFIQNLGNRTGGPPKLRITGIDVPQPGFRPAERIEETGHRLADYAKSFNVPFEYQAIASKYEDIRAEDLRIDKDEVLIVNCLNRSENLMDETVLLDSPSPRDTFLKNIKEMNPDLFILGVTNGTYNSPFFVTRFREVLFYFSALFDMLETTVPREEEQRGLIESELFGRVALNVISCEGADRVERPETYKQWQARTIRAGFEQVQVNRVIVKQAREKVRSNYHGDFILDEDSKWLMQGWKGRITQAISTWKPTQIH